MWDLDNFLRSKKTEREKVKKGKERKFSANPKTTRRN